MNQSSATTIPTILLVEDDPVSASFLCEAAAQVPARINVAASIAAALGLAASQRHDLFLIDAHLPDGRGETLLHTLRRQGFTAPALAHTAARESSLVAQLVGAGFVEVLGKPLGVAELLRTLRRHLPTLPAGMPTCGKLPVWDDDAALATLGGVQSHVTALRGLFLGELPGQRMRISAACLNGDAATVCDELHRLVASCGFVGASRLAQAVRALQAAPLDPQVLQALQFAIDDAMAST